MTTDAAHARLEAERTRLLEVQAAAERLHTRDDEGHIRPSDEALPSESARETIDREIDESVAQQAALELAEIDAALERIAAGTYGTCEVCGTAIPEGRLEIMPATRMCVEDQAKAEKER